jgi:hypothetical protein
MLVLWYFLHTYIHIPCKFPFSGCHKTAVITWSPEGEEEEEEAIFLASNVSTTFS